MNTEKMTFTIFVPMYNHNSAGNRCLHILSQLLYKLRHDVYLYNFEQHGSKVPDNFNGIPITDGMPKGIPIVPEAFSFSTSNYPHVRWVLNYPGKLFNGPKIYNENIMATYYLDEFKDATIQATKSGIIHKFCIGNIELIKPIERVDKTLILWYRGKYSQQIDVSKHKYQLELTRTWPATQQQYWELLHMTKELYSYDDLTGTTLEAYKTGVKVYTYHSQVNKWMPLAYHIEHDNVFIDHDRDLNNTRKFVEQCKQWYNNLPK